VSNSGTLPSGGLDKPKTTCYNPVAMRLRIGNTEALSTTEAAEALGVHYATVFRWIKSGKLLSIRLDGRTFIPKSEVEKLKASAT